MPGPGLLITAVLVPALVAGACFAVAWRRGAPSRGAWGVPVGLACAYAAGQIGVSGVPPFPPIDGTHWIFWLGAAAAAVAAIEASGRAWPVWSRWTVRAAFAVALAGLMLRPLVKYSWSGAGAALRLGTVVVLLVGFWTLLELALPRSPARSQWLALCIVASGASIALALSGSLALGLLAAGIASGAGAGLVASLPFGARVIPRAGLAVPAVLLGGLLLAGRFYADLPAASALLLFAAPAAAAVRGRPRLLALQIAILLAAAAAAVLVAWDSSPPFDPYDYGRERAPSFRLAHSRHFSTAAALSAAPANGS